MRNSDHMREPRAPAADGFIEVEGARLRLRDDGQGFPVLLVHGWALDLDMWRPQAEAWAGRWRVIRYDRRGFGCSSGAPSLAADVRDIESLLRRLNLQRVAIVGMSQGARGAMQAAAGALRERIACLVLDGAPFDSRDSDEPEVPLERYRELARTAGLEAVRNEWRRHPFATLQGAERSAHELLPRSSRRPRGRSTFLRWS
jgi:pimeloyl-ACP methyl ester carboxylesterase